MTYNGPLTHDGLRVCAHQCTTCIFRPGGRPTTPCKEWTGATSGGYGVRRVAGRLFRVHRLAWEERHGLIPDGYIVTHKCDNPPCYEVTHLTLGTHKTNSDEKWARGRGNAPRGEKAGRARLTEAQVFEVLERLDKAESQRSIARAFGVSPGAIQGIAGGRNWKHLIDTANLMQLRPGRVREMVDGALAGDSVIPCHKTLHGERAVCRGFYDRHKTNTLACRLGQVIGVIEIDPDTEDATT